MSWGGNPLWSGGPLLETGGAPMVFGGAAPKGEALELGGAAPKGEALEVGGAAPKGEALELGGAAPKGKALELGGAAPKGEALELGGAAPKGEAPELGGAAPKGEALELGGPARPKGEELAFGGITSFVPANGRGEDPLELTVAAPNGLGLEVCGNISEDGCPSVKLVAGDSFELLGEGVGFSPNGDGLGGAKLVGAVLVLPKKESFSVDGGPKRFDAGEGAFGGWFSCIEMLSN